MFRGLSKLRSERSGSQSQQDVRRVSGGKSELAITAPKRIVRALYPYAAQHTDELSFNKNDFFYVNEEVSGDWYVASNPLTNVQGLVPQAYFEVIQRQDPQAVPVSQARRAHSRSASAASGASNQGSVPIMPHALSNHSKKASQSSHMSNRRASLAIYGLVLYDFQAERNDELTVSAGESIVIVAQSTEEWFVAKPIGRLGGPGLIPVSYVELREVGSDQPLQDVQDAIRRANLPQVDEWKRKLAEYKASSIPLGRFGTTSDQLHASSNHSASHSRSVSAALSAKSHQSGQSDYSTHSNLYTSPGKMKNGSANTNDKSNYAVGSSSIAGTPSSRQNPNGRNHIEPFVISATVDRFAVNGGRYWYLVKVEMSNGNHRNLCRFYQDFYDFQIKLLEQFPDEAGRTGKTRTLPFMPGPLTLVTHTVSSQRRANLDDYVRDLIRMPPHVSQSPIVLQLFSVRPGDVESSEATQQLPQPPEDESEQQYSGDIPALIETSEPADQLNQNNAQLSTDHDASYQYRQQQQQQQQQPQYHQPPQLHQNQYDSPIYGQRSASVDQSEVSLSQPTLKIKVFASPNVIAIRVPVEIPFSEIYDKIATRLSMPSPKLYTNSECSGEPVDNAAKFARALNGGTKIALYLG